MMKNTAMQDRLEDEIIDFVASRKSLQLASITEEGEPFASYAPFAIGEDCLYVLLSDIAVHAKNLKANPKASVLVLEDEDSAGELFARIRVNYNMRADHIAVDSEGWKEGIDALAERLGERSRSLSELADFNLFKLVPQYGRYVKGFGKAYAFKGEALAGTDMDHMRDGHKKRA
jgi:putative heme iron utilization protein